MTEDKIRVKIQMGILKPASEIFEAIVDPEKMTKYFISGSTGRIENGKTITWSWKDVGAETTIKVGKIEMNKIISFEWNGNGVKRVVVITLEPKDDKKTLVIITEDDWSVDYKSANQCMGQVGGWMNFLCCLKAYLEYGVNLRVGAFNK